MPKVSRYSQLRIAESIRKFRFSLESLEARNSPSDLLYGMLASTADSNNLAAADTSNHIAINNSVESKTDAGSNYDSLLNELNLDSTDSTTAPVGNSSVSVNTTSIQNSQSPVAPKFQDIGSIDDTPFSDWNLDSTDSSSAPVSSSPVQSNPVSFQNSQSSSPITPNFQAISLNAGLSSPSGQSASSSSEISPPINLSDSSSSATNSGGGTNDTVSPITNFLAFPGGRGTVTPNWGGGGSGSGITPFLSGNFTPSQINQAYGFTAYDNTLPAGTLPGAGMTIALIEDGNDPTILTDGNTFNTQYNLPQFVETGSNPNFSVVNQTGGSSLPSNDTSWAVETSLDMEWAHAIAPGAKILVVEATESGNATANLYIAAAYGGAHAQTVSMSFGTGDSSSDASYDASTFEQPNVAFCASAGDNGYGVSYPASSPYVLAVGGTTLTLTSSNSWSSETAWSGSGGGVTTHEAEPAYQIKAAGSTLGGRGMPDVAFDANPSSGVEVYDSDDGGWFDVGGTSLSSPCWAALLAIVDQGRMAPHSPGATLGYVSTDSLRLSPEYDAAANAIYYPKNYHDITSGSTGSGSAAQAKVGWDQTTGVGSPIANNIIPWLIANN